MQQEEAALEVQVQLKPYAMPVLCAVLPEHSKRTELIKKCLKNIDEK